MTTKTADPALAIPLDERSRALRRRIVQILRAARRGHLGSTYSLIEIVRVLYDDLLSYNVDNPQWRERDRFILSKGHGCLAHYVLLADKGFFPDEVLDTFCAAGSILGGHPDALKVPGVEASTGALGHGLSIGVGMAIAGKAEGRRVFVTIGDGESNEGSVWEAALSAGNRSVDNLTVIVDYNKLQSYGPTAEVQDLEPLADKWRAFGFAVAEVNGHDVDALRALFQRVPLEAGRPTAVIAHTVKGKGISFAEYSPQWHHKSNITDADLDRILAELGEPCAKPL